MGTGDGLGRAVQADLFGAAHGQARHVVLQGQRVPYALRRSQRRTIGFQIGPQGLRVTAPKWVGIAQIEAGLVERADWILRKLSEQRARGERLDAARIVWQDGATIPFLGQPLAMALDARARGVVLQTQDDGSAPVLRVGLPPDAPPDRVRELVRGWLQRQARRLFLERIAQYEPRLGVRARRLALSSAGTRWGSASADGSVRLNWKLVHFELPVIDYVVAHELAHLREMNHSPAFWALVEQVHPDVAGARRRLREAVMPALE